MIIPAHLGLIAVPLHLHLTAHALQIIFLVGVAGCLISIPIIAIKFASVLFERGEDDNEQNPQVPVREDDEANYGAIDERVPKR